jgi:hypothetical protein
LIILKSLTNQKKLLFHILLEGFLIGLIFRIAMFDSNFKDAQKHLEYAFNHCDKNSKKNKKLILQYCMKVDF